MNLSKSISVNSLLLYNLYYTNDNHAKELYENWICMQNFRN